MLEHFRDVARLSLLVNLAALAGGCDDSAWNGHNGCGYDWYANNHAILPDSDLADCPNSNRTIHYCEGVPERQRIDDLRVNYHVDDRINTALKVAARRYPLGLWFMTGNRDCARWMDRWFPVEDTRTFDDVLRCLNLTIHEMGHFFDLGEGRVPGTDTFCVLVDWCLTIPEDTYTFNRDQIVSLLEEDDLNQYYQIYLTGEVGAQDFSTLLEELTQFINSLFYSYMVIDVMSPDLVWPTRDGLLNMMYFTELYLRLGESDYPGVYGSILETEAYRELIKTLWGRAEFVLGLSEEYKDRLSADGEDDRVTAKVYREENIRTIIAIRDYH